MKPHNLAGSCLGRRHETLASTGGAVPRTLIMLKPCLGCWSGWHLSQTNLSIHNIFPSSLITLSQYQWWYPHVTVNDNFPNLYAFKIHEHAYLDLNCRAPKRSFHRLATVLRFDGCKCTCASSSTSGTVRYPSIFKFGPPDPTRGPEASIGWNKKKA